MRKIILYQRERTKTWYAEFQEVSEVSGERSIWGSGLSKEEALGDLIEYAFRVRPDVLTFTIEQEEHPRPHDY